MRSMHTAISSMTLSPKVLFLLCFFSIPVTFAQTVPAQQQDMSALYVQAKEFLTTKTRDLSDDVQVEITPLDKRMQLARCGNPEPFIPNGGRLWGTTSVGMRCTSDATWTVYFKANVKIIANYLVASSPLKKGQTLSMQDFTLVRGDLSLLPNGTITDPQQALDKVTKAPIRAGNPIRHHNLVQPAIILRGQTVSVVSSGPGFQVATEAIAISDATEGQVARAKTENGQIVSGIAKIGGIIEVRF